MTGLFHCAQDSEKLFSSLPNYFKAGGKVKGESYILAQ